MSDRATAPMTVEEFYDANEKWWLSNVQVGHGKHYGKYHTMSMYLGFAEAYHAYRAGAEPAAPTPEKCLDVCPQCGSDNKGVFATKLTKGCHSSYPGQHHPWHDAASSSVHVNPALKGHGTAQSPNHQFVSFVEGEAKLINSAASPSELERPAQWKGKPVSVACLAGRHQDCTETLDTCNCTYRGLHKTMHRYATSPAAESSLAALPTKPEYGIGNSPAALDEVETISARVHERWMESKRTKGVTTRRSESGEELMVPYGELSEAAKDLDRGSVKAVLAALRAESAKEK